MKKIFLALFFPGFLLMQDAAAFIIDDAPTGAKTYWGGDAHGYGDIIGGSLFDVRSAEVIRTGDLLTIRINTNFAGHAGVDTWAATRGIGYGDLFLAPVWKPAGSDAHHVNDNAANDGSHWTYGLNLDNRWNNAGGTFGLYKLNGSDLSDTLLSDSFLTCRLGVQCYYRNGQEVAVNTRSATVQNTGRTGAWTVVSDSRITFVLNVAGTELAQYSDIALHWGETCQNDVIEGVGSVPEPTPFALLGLGLLTMGWGRRRPGK